MTSRRIFFVHKYRFFSYLLVSRACNFRMSELLHGRENEYICEYTALSTSRLLTHSCLLHLFRFIGRTSTNKISFMIDFMLIIKMNMVITPGENKLSIFGFADQTMYFTFCKKGIINIQSLKMCSRKMIFQMSALTESRIADKTKPIFAVQSCLFSHDFSLIMLCIQSASQFVVLQKFQSSESFSTYMIFKYIRYIIYFAMICYDYCKPVFYGMHIPAVLCPFFVILLRMIKRQYITISFYCTLF